MIERQIDVMVQRLPFYLKKEECKSFLARNAGNIHLTDFSLHSIGVICFRYGKEKLFQKFLKDVLPFVDLITLPLDQYYEVIKNRKKHNLDFDDSYQYTAAGHYDLKIVTMDKDFKKVDDIEVLFL